MLLIFIMCFNYLLSSFLESVSQVEGKLSSVSNRQDSFANQFQTLSSTAGALTTDVQTLTDDVQRDIAIVTREQDILKSDLTSLTHQQRILNCSIETVRERHSIWETQVQADLTTIRSEQTSTVSTVQGKNNLVTV